MQRFTVTTNRNNTKNICDQNGFQYIKAKASANKAGESLWSCNRRRHWNCKAVVKTLGDFIVAMKHDHTCM